MGGLCSRRHPPPVASRPLAARARQAAQPLLDPWGEAEPLEAWRYLVHKLRRIRRLQRLFHLIGAHLKECCAPQLKKQLSKHFLPLERRTGADERRARRGRGPLA